MLTLIKEALGKAGINTWMVEETHTQSGELFFIRRSLDMRRMKETRKYCVKVYHDFEKDGKPMRGMSSVSFVPSQTKEEILDGLKEAYFSASFVENPTYELPEKQVCAPKDDEDGFKSLSVEDAALKMADAIFAADHDEKAFVNTAEIFAVRTDVRLLTSKGTDVGYAKYEITGEFVAQCKEPQDVELYHSFDYDNVDCEALKSKVASALKEAADRAVARPELPTGEYDLILSGDNVATVLSYYVTRSDVEMIFPGYSRLKIGDEVQKTPVKGEKLDMTLHARAPFSAEGIPMADRPLIKDGKLATYHGTARLSSYLGVPATGEYTAFCCGNGKLPFEEMKKEPYLYAVAFSDFQMDPMSGNFGGEIRLAYYFDGKETRIVTGGSVQGSINTCGDSLEFSKEKYFSRNYTGPFAVKLKGVMAAGSLGI